MMPFPIRVRRWAAQVVCAAGLVLALSALAADATTPAVQLGDSLSDIKAKLGEPRSDLEAGDQIILIYPDGQIVLRNGRATSIELGATPPPKTTAAPPTNATAAIPPVKTAPGFIPDTIPPDYEAAHPPDVRLIEQKDADGVVTILAESDTNLEFTVTLEAELTNMAASAPLPVTMDSAGQKSVVLVQLRRQDPAQAFSYKTTFHFRRGARRTATTNDAIYLLPYSAGETHRVGQGNFGKFSHFEGSENEYATDFTCDPGTTVCAARAGVVTGCRQDFSLGGADEKFKDLGNYIIIKHDDGTFAEYFHLQHNGVLVQLGQRVAAGQPIGKSGATGHVTGPHIHFCVFQNIDGKDRLTLPTKFQTS